MPDFQSSYKVLLIDKTLPGEDFRPYDGGSLNIFCI